MDLKSYIRDVPDFPKAGIIFKDITPLLASGEALADAVARMADPWRDRGVDLVVSAEARGFILGAAVALELGAGFIPVRKPGKLPWKSVSKTYELEYGTDTLCLHADAVKPGQRVLLLDDLLATGGTMAACAALCRELGGEVLGVAFLIELSFLGGRSKLDGLEVQSLIDYAGE
jgi:adenine phosphoribosyltransferase